MDAICLQPAAAGDGWRLKTRRFCLLHLGDEFSCGRYHFLLQLATKNVALQPWHRVFLLQSIAMKPQWWDDVARANLPIFLAWEVVARAANRWCCELGCLVRGVWRKLAVLVPEMIEEDSTGWETWNGWLHSRGCILCNELSDATGAPAQSEPLDAQ